MKYFGTDGIRGEANVELTFDLGVVLFFIFWSQNHLAYGILVPQPGMEPGSSEVETWES